jgi:trehalose synthase
MWKGRPVVASADGGLQEQIEEGVSGELIADPRDLAGFGRAVSHLLRNDTMRRQMGKAAVERVRELYLSDRHLERWGDVISHVVTTS